MHKGYKVAIIGGGASGLMCAVELVGGDNKIAGDGIVILERKDRVGKKLIATGNGQGNLSNADFSADHYYGETDFVKKFVEKAKEIDIEKYLYNIGIPLVTDNNGKKYPLSKQASAVLDTIRERLIKNNVETKVGFNVINVTKKGDLFYIESEKERVVAENVVLAFGGSSGKQFGTDGTSYSLAESFGHKKTALYPSLVQIKTDTEYIKSLKGIKEDATVSVIYNGKEIKRATGEVLFTDYGLSGNAVFAVSSAIGGIKNLKIKLAFLPDYTEEEVEKLLNDKLKNTSDKENLLCGIVNKRVGKEIIKKTGKKDPQVKDISKTLKNFFLDIKGTMGFDNSQVTKGGIITQDVYPDSMESKIKSGLYLIGELLDIDGDCGGYNLTFAFVGGIVSARAIKEKYGIKGRKKC